MRRKCRRVAQMMCALSVAAAAGQALGNSGIQLPLSAYDAGAEEATPVTNGRFTDPGTTQDPPASGQYIDPPGWTRSGDIVVAAPFNPPANAASVNPYAAQARQTSGASSFIQAAPALSADTNYILSAYVWNSGRYDVSGFGGGELATLRVSDPLNSFSNVAMILEGQGSDGQSGAGGRFMYLLFNQADTATWSSVNIEVVAETGTVAGDLTAPWAQFDNIALTPASEFVAQKWLSNVSGDWTDNTKWLGANPTGAGAVASFTDGITANQTVTLNAPRTVSVVNFDNATASYLISGGNALTLDIVTDGFGTPQGVPEINVVAGHHTIAAPVTLLRNTVLNVTAADGSLTLSGNFNATGRTVTKRGAGLATVNRVRSAGLVLSGGTLRIAPDSSAAAVSKVTNLSVVAGAKLDLTDNKLITSTPAGTWDGSAYTDVAGLVDSARGDAGNALWNGTTGITTSDTRAINNGDLVSIGVAQVSEVRSVADTETTTFAGQTVLGSDTIAMATWGGDATLDGKINIDDYGRIDGNVGQSGSVFGWSRGDFNYDGKINIDDYGIIDGNINRQGVAFSVGGSAIEGVAAVPEPAGLSFVAVAAAALLRRRRMACSG